MTREKPFSATFKLEKETKNTVCYAEEAEGRRPGTMAGAVKTAYEDWSNAAHGTRTDDGADNRVGWRRFVLYNHSVESIWND